MLEASLELVGSLGTYRNAPDLPSTRGVRPLHAAKQLINWAQCATISSNSNAGYFTEQRRMKCVRGPCNALQQTSKLPIRSVFKRGGKMGTPRQHVA